MRKLLRYKNGKEYIQGGIVSIVPNGVNPIEELDLSDLTNEEFTKFRQNMKDKKLLRKARKINGR